MYSLKKYFILVIIVCICLFILVGCKKNNGNSNNLEINIVSENDNSVLEDDSNIVSKNDNSILEGNSNKEKDNTSKNSKLTNKEMYGNLISNYEKALEEYDLEDFEIDEKIEKKYGIKDSTLLMHISRYSDNDVKLNYGFYDIDKNGIDELVLKADDAIGAIYTFNKKSNKPELIFAQDTLERGEASIYDNGIIASNGSGGAALHYYEFGKIAKDETSYELIENIEEEYVENSDKPIYKEPNSEKRLQYNSLDEIMDKYISNSQKVTISNEK